MEKVGGRGWRHTHYTCKEQEHAAYGQSLPPTAVPRNTYLFLFYFRGRAMTDVLVLRRAGLTDAQIVAVVAEEQAERREAQRQAQRRYRARISNEINDRVISQPLQAPPHEKPQQNQSPRYITLPSPANPKKEKVSIPSKRKNIYNTNSPLDLSLPLELSLEACEAERSSGRRKGTRIPEGWEPGEAGMEFAVAAGVRNILREADRFRDYWLAKAGPNGVKLDWSATWRNWCRKAAESNNGKRTVQEAAHDLVGRLKAFGDVPAADGGRSRGDLVRLLPAGGCQQSRDLLSGRGSGPGSVF